MSTDIKRHPADWSKDLGIDVLDPDGWRADGQPWGRWITEQEFRRRAAMSTVREVATPAPLDPKLVHVGDTVTVTIAAMGDTPEFQITGPVYSEGYEGDGLVVGDYMLMHKRVTLTAHQPAPAPEPEPEWEMGQVAVVTPHRKDDLTTRAIHGEDGNWHNAYGGFWSDDEVAVRPLVVIDPAAVDVEALVTVAHHDRVLYGDTTPDQMRRAILRILAHIGIEVAR